MLKMIISSLHKSSVQAYSTNLTFKPQTALIDDVDHGQKNKQISPKSNPTIGAGISAKSSPTKTVSFTQSTVPPKIQLFRYSPRRILLLQL